MAPQDSQIKARTAARRRAKSHAGRLHLLSARAPPRGAARAHSVSDTEDYGHRFTALPSRTPTPARLTSAVALTWRPLLQVAAPRPCACPSGGLLRVAGRQLGTARQSTAKGCPGRSPRHTRVLGKALVCDPTALMGGLSSCFPVRPACAVMTLPLLIGWMKRKRKDV